MAAGAQTRSWAGPSRRRVPRFHVRAPLDVTVLRSGIPDTVPGRSVNMCERGIAAVLAGDLVPGEAVGIEVRLPLAGDPLRTRAMVRYQAGMRCGLEFVGLSVEQRGAIRDWVKDAKAEAVTDVASVDASAVEKKVEQKQAEERREERKIEQPSRAEKPRIQVGDGTETSRAAEPRPPGRKHRLAGWIVGLILLAAAGGVLWFRWNRAWDRLEAGLKREMVPAERVQAQVPAEVMEKLLVHRVEPIYPAEARQAKLEGIVALDIVVGRDGSVVSMRPLNGPDVLARAAMDALRWWRFEPYRVNGEPAAVETTVAVEFKR